MQTNKLWLAVVFIFSACASKAQNLELFELKKRCSVEADSYWQKRKNEIISPSSSAINFVTNHYNKKSGLCLLRYDYMIINDKDFKSITVYDVLENKMVSNFLSLTNNITKNYWVRSCKLSDGGKCNSEDEFERDAQRLMSE